MKQKKKARSTRDPWMIRPAYILLMVISLVQTGMLYYYKERLAYLMLPIVLLVIGYCIYRLLEMQQDVYRSVRRADKEMEKRSGHLISFSLPAVILNENEEILWYNEVFRQEVLKGHDIFLKPLSGEIDTPLSKILSDPGKIISCRGEYYQAYPMSLPPEGDKPAPVMLWMLNVTKLQKTSMEYKASRPMVMTLMVDSYDESVRNLNDRERISMVSELQKLIQDMADSCHAFVQRLHDNRYMLIIENRYIERLKKERFPILNSVKSLAPPNTVPLTLSIGIGQVIESLQQAQEDSRQALDMALGRGGDQVALKSDGGYEFFGGVSKGLEKHTKVKTRIVANALTELIQQSENVLVMGHKFADLDAVGAGVGMAQICRSLGKEARIVLDYQRCLGKEVVDQLVNNGDMVNCFTAPDQSLSYIKEKTLLIIVDTHSPALIESEQVYKRCKNVVVIDHHRKAVNYIENAAIFYHEPFASSASEMVAELIPYIKGCRITSTQAEALLAGITLDTKNFILRTGVRTFEAAAYLRKCGADTIAVRRLFATTMDAYQSRSSIVASAIQHRRCAIAICDIPSDDIRVVCAQAADELLNIAGVDAAFVIFQTGDIVNISARSMGALNVQVLMEKMGGGGHHTMAAVQMKGVTIEKARQDLLRYIDEIYQ